MPTTTHNLRTAPGSARVPLVRVQPANMPPAWCPVWCPVRGRRGGSMAVHVPTIGSHNARHGARRV